MNTGIIHLLNWKTKFRETFKYVANIKTIQSNMWNFFHISKLSDKGVVV